VTKDELLRTVEVANTSNNVDTRVEMKVDAILRFLLQEAAPAAEPVALTAVVANGEYASHPTTAHSGVLYDVLPPRMKLNTLTLDQLRLLAERRGLEPPRGPKASIIDALLASAEDN